MNENLKKIAVSLFLHNETISIATLKSISGIDDNKELENIFNELNLKLNELGLVLLRDTNKNFEKQNIVIAVKKEFIEIAKNIKKIDLEGELTPASLQVITIIAYLDGVTKNEISFIRGIESGKSIRTLSSRGLIKNENGKYFLTIDALKEMGISNISDLPDFESIQKDFKEKLAEILEEEKKD